MLALRGAHAAQRVWAPGPNLCVEAFSEADEAIFDKANWVLIPIAHSRYDDFKTFIDQLNVNIIEMEADRHDKLVALSSHFPFLMASLLVNLVKELPEKEQALFKYRQDFGGN